jgi:hypothetical protein
MTDDNWRPGPQYRANSFQMAFCADPNCGLHLVAYDANGKPMSEIVMTPKQTLGVIELCQKMLYEKVVSKS